MKQVFSKFGQISSTDFVKSLAVTVFAAVIPIIKATIESGSLVFDWKNIATVGISAGLAYLMKQLFTNSDNQLFTGEK